MRLICDSLGICNSQSLRGDATVSVTSARSQDWNSRATYATLEPDPVFETVFNVIKIIGIIFLVVGVVLVKLSIDQS